MKKFLTLLSLSVMVLLTSMLSYADPPSKGEKGRDVARQSQNHPSGKFDDDADDDRIKNERRLREERGYMRLKQHKWQAGYIMPQHYRGNSYKVDYRDFDLPKPARNQQWYKINNDLILVDTETNSILRIVGI